VALPCLVQTGSRLREQTGAGRRGQRLRSGSRQGSGIPRSLFVPGEPRTERRATADEQWQFGVDVANHLAQKPRPAPRAALPDLDGAAERAERAQWARDAAAAALVDPAMEGRPEGMQTVKDLRDEAALKMVRRERLWNKPKGSKPGAKTVQDKDYTNTCCCCEHVFKGSITRVLLHVKSDNCVPKTKKLNADRTIRVAYQEMRDKQKAVRAEIEKYGSQLATLERHEHEQGRAELRRDVMEMETDGTSPLKLAGAKRKLEHSSPQGKLGFQPRKTDHRSQTISEQVTPFSRDPSPFTLPAS
jgi:hypothetical protein